METKFTAYRDMVRGMNQEDRTLLASACIVESREAGTAPLQYDWNKASAAIETAHRKTMEWLTGQD